MRHRIRQIGISVQQIRESDSRFLGAHQRKPNLPARPRLHLPTPHACLVRLANRGAKHQHDNEESAVHASNLQKPTRKENASTTAKYERASRVYEDEYVRTFAFLSRPEQRLTLRAR
jgi:hypothetical protein